MMARLVRVTSSAQVSLPPGWHEVGWDHVERMREEFPPLTAHHLTVDAANPLPLNVETVLRYTQNL